MLLLYLLVSMYWLWWLLDLVIIWIELNIFWLFTYFNAYLKFKHQISGFNFLYSNYPVLFGLPNLQIWHRYSSPHCIPYYNTALWMRSSDPARPKVGLTCFSLKKKKKKKIISLFFRQAVRRCIDRSGARSSNHFRWKRGRQDPVSGSFSRHWERH